MSDYPDFEDIVWTEGPENRGEHQNQYVIPCGMATAFQRLLDAIHKVEAKVDAMENRLLPPGYAFVPKREITQANHPSCGNLYNLETEPR